MLRREHSLDAPGIWDLQAIQDYVAQGSASNVDILLINCFILNFL